VSGRRRTPGLRREEVAQRSGVGLSWYTWLEQGRDVSPSAQVLTALARALELSVSERAHLFQLAGVAQPAPPEGPVDAETVSLVHGLLPHVAFVLSPRFDVVAHNAAAELIMGDLLREPPPRRNLLRWFFDGTWDGQSPAWAQTARANLLDFRTEYARHLDDPDYVALVDELAARSATFRAWWDEHEVQVLEPARKQIRHPTLGPLTWLSSQSRPAHQPWLRLRILVAGDEPTRRAVLAATSGAAGCSCSTGTASARPGTTAR
jgi:transcriptional regulator with XRE-family HTH domain